MKALGTAIGFLGSCVLLVTPALIVAAAHGVTCGVATYISTRLVFLGIVALIRPRR